MEDLTIMVREEGLSAAEDAWFRASCAKVLASAFYDDPVWCWMLGVLEVPAYRAHWRWVWDTFVNTGRRLRHPALGPYLAYETATKKPVGTQIWYAPYDAMSHWDLLTSGFLGAPRRFGLAGVGRVLSMMTATEGIHARIMGQAPHCFLQALGIHADAQGQGRGTWFISHVLSVIDAANLPCYLESSNPKNIPFYQRVGFGIVEEYRHEATAPVVTLMVRPAARESIPSAPFLVQMNQAAAGKKTPLTSSQEATVAYLIHLMAQAEAGDWQGRSRRIFWWTMAGVVTFVAFILSIIYI